MRKLSLVIPSLCRGAVCAIWAFGKRCDHFCEIICDGNNKEWFKGETIQIPNLELLHDIWTRWDSLYKIISRFRDLRQVSEKFHYHSLVLTMQQVSDHFLSSLLNKDLAQFHMTDAEWGVLKDFQMILSVCPHMLWIEATLTLRPGSSSSLRSLMQRANSSLGKRSSRLGNDDDCLGTARCKVPTHGSVYQHWPWVGSQVLWKNGLVEGIYYGYR